MNEYADPKFALKALLKGVTPERSSELNNLWDLYKPDVEVTKNHKNINISASKRVIKFDLKSLNVIWLLGFNGWRSIETYSPAIVLSILTQTPIDSVLQDDDEIRFFEREYKSQSEFAQRCIDSESPLNEEWPEDIPKPTANRESLKSDIDKAAFDLVCIATAYVFFHEFKHVMFRHEEAAMTDKREEELACDTWARSFITDKIEKYVESVQIEYESILKKRTMGMALGAMILNNITPEHAKWGNLDYPPISYRINALVDGSTLEDDSPYWLFVACLFLGESRKSHMPCKFACTSYRSLAQKLISTLP